MVYLYSATPRPFVVAFPIVTPFTLNTTSDCTTGLFNSSIIFAFSVIVDPAFVVLSGIVIVEFSF